MARLHALSDAAEVARRRLPAERLDLAEAPGHPGREGARVPAAQPVTRELGRAVSQQRARALEISVGEVLEAHRDLDEALERLALRSFGAQPERLEHLVRLEVEARVEERGRFRQTGRRRRIGGGERSVREGPRGAGRALAEGGRVGAEARANVPAVGVAIEELRGKTRGGRGGGIERARIGADRGDRLEPPARRAVVQRVEDEVGEPVPQGRRQRHDPRARRPASRPCAARIWSRWFRSCSAQWASICGIVRRPYSGCRPCCLLCAALSRPT